MDEGELIVTDMPVDQRVWRALWTIDIPGMRADLVDALVDARAKLEQGEADVLVLAARRMACLYALMVQNGFQPPRRGTVMSDRFILLTRADWWRGKRVILLDDTSLTGKTLAQRKGRLQSLEGVVSISARPAVKLNSAKYSFVEVRDCLHEVYARAFGEKLVPYFTDFPVSLVADVDSVQVSRLVNMAGWSAVDVTNSAVAGGPVKNYTLFPDQERISAFWGTNQSLPQLVQVAKLRLFTVLADDRRISTRFVPVVLIKAVTEDSARAAAEALGLDPLRNGEILAQTLSLISYLLSERLLDVIRDIMPKGESRQFVPDGALEILVFGPELCSRLAHFRDRLDEALSVLDVSDKSAAQHDPAFSFVAEGQPPTFGVGSRYYVMGDDVVGPVNELFGTDGSFTVEEKRITLPLTQLAEARRSNADTTSLALDVLNDMGLTVPEFVTRNGEVSRVFRAGEVRPQNPRTGRLGGKLAQVASTFAVRIAEDEAVGSPLFPRA